MRIKGEREKISYEETKNFFDERVKKLKDENPYAVTMYQDDNPNLVFQRNQEEINVILPKLEVNCNVKLLDVACGIGRWSDAIASPIALYWGCDFCEGLIDAAKNRNAQRNRFFSTCKSIEIRETLRHETDELFNRVIVMGLLLYLNDEDVEETLNQVEELCEEHTIICIREVVGVDGRLTLKDNYSEELKSNYNAIYRTIDEYHELLNQTLGCKGFAIEDEGYLFGNSKLNNRKETTQYYFVLKR